MGRLTLGFGKSQLVLVGWALWHPVAVAENIGTQLAELDRGRANHPHPAFMTNVLRDKRGPYGNRLARPTTGCGFKTYATRSFVAVDAEGVQVLRVCDFTSLTSVTDWPLHTEDVPAEVYLLVLAPIPNVIEAVSDALRDPILILTLHRDSSAIEKNHPCTMVRYIA